MAIWIAKIPTAMTIATRPATASSWLKAVPPRRIAVASDICAHSQLIVESAAVAKSWAIEPNTSAAAVLETVPARQVTVLAGSSERQLTPSPAIRRWRWCRTRDASERCRPTTTA